MKPGKNIKAKTKTQKAVILTLMILLAGIVAAYAGVRNMTISLKKTELMKPGMKLWICFILFPHQ